MTLNELNINQKGVVININNECMMKQRFIDIGIIDGTKVECALVSPGKDPKAYVIKGALIAIRNEDAKFIEIEVCE